MDKRKTAKKLVELREKNNLSREQVAVDLHISYAALAAYETAERTPRDSMKVKIADYYKTSVEEIFFIQ